MSESQIPKLDELLERISNLLDEREFNRYQESFEAYFFLVASGKVKMLGDSNAMFAAQCVLILVEHVRGLKAQKESRVTE